MLSVYQIKIFSTGFPATPRATMFPTQQHKQPVDFVNAVEAHLIENTSRVSTFEYGGQKLWVKQIELTSGRSRFFKPAPRHNFDCEIKAYEELRSKEAAVPDMLLKSSRYFVLADAGPTLEAFWRDDEIDQETRVLASKKAGQALAQLHALGVAHGRPVARDVCWDGKQVLFLDFENHSHRRNGVRGRAFDLLCFFHSVCSQPVKDEVALQASIDGYKRNDQTGVWQEASVLVRRFGWLEVFTRPIQTRKSPHAREFKSLPIVRQIFT